MIGTFFNKFPERAGHNSFSLLSLTSLHLFNMFHKYIVRKRKSMTVLISVCSSVVEYLIRSCFFLRLFLHQVLLVVVFVLIVDLVSLLFKLFRVVARASFASVTLSQPSTIQQYNKQIDLDLQKYNNKINFDLYDTTSRLISTYVQQAD